MKKISQREARQLRKEVAELKAVLRSQHIHWSKDYPGGVHLTTIGLSDVGAAKLLTAQRLSHALVARAENNELRIYALKYPAL